MRWGHHVDLVTLDLIFGKLLQAVVSPLRVRLATKEQHQAFLADLRADLIRAGERAAAEAAVAGGPGEDGFGVGVRAEGTGAGSFGYVWPKVRDSTVECHRCADGRYYATNLGALSPPSLPPDQPFSSPLQLA